MKQQVTYLDHAAATPLDERVLAEMKPYFAERFYNPSAGYEPARRVLADLNQARARIAHHLGVRSSEIIFTSGGTEANNLAIRGVMEHYPAKRVLVSAIEHESVLAPAADYPSCCLLPVSDQGIIDLKLLERRLDDDTVLISIMQANNEVGTVQPLAKIAQLIKKTRADRHARKITLPLYLHTDSAQAANYLDLHVHRLGVDMMTLNSGKLYGPKGAGALFVSSKIALFPQIAGGGQERGMRSGTENVAGAVGMAAALDLAQNMRVAESHRLAGIQVVMLERLQQLMPNAIVNGSRKYRLPNNVHITLPGQDNERLLMLLEAQGVYAAAGSACSALSAASSHVLQAMGLSESDARASLRFTFGRPTDRQDVERAVQVLAKLA